ncbi:hypothetical protein CQW23_30978 [Capsicum baccatum]|uniref:Uncharacterized protein n=3 Tax=Capsicum TaxID=4071 RepID=A0A075VW55_CAPAN|nr:hypothetical protein [Capsicum annuum]PHT29432.1 hypothetical protein CQW23_30978 [Capsicum baccatum]QFV19602.1 hypothetical protein [Capsicum annuum var. glabriusculum]AIG89975.1 hypothetical protein [Capsicum annuum]AIG90113.1 hypothetical protein [Capsicum annuum]PHT76049.1 hypothetical protein T459_19571 [Capsicum annuum]
MSNFSQFRFLPLHGSKTSNYYMALLLLGQLLRLARRDRQERQLKLKLQEREKEGELDELTTPTVTGSKREWTEHLFPISKIYQSPFEMKTPALLSNFPTACE